MRRMVLASMVLLSACASVSAQEQPAQQPACPAVAEPWKAPRTIASARDAASAAQAAFAVGEAVRLSLHPDGEVAYLTLPQGEGEAASFGGMASFAVEQAGTYRVGLSEPVWVDVVYDGKPAETVRFGPGPACSGIRKAVSFALEPGPHAIEISGGTTAGVRVLVERLP
ncbi:MAG TPA: homogentisate 1,2-dioxygenase [Croceibacterium sp.]